MWLFTLCSCCSVQQSYRLLFPLSSGIKPEKCQGFMNDFLQLLETPPPSVYVEANFGLQKGFEEPYLYLRFQLLPSSKHGRPTICCIPRTSHEPSWKEHRVRTSPLSCYPWSRWLVPELTEAFTTLQAAGSGERPGPHVIRRGRRSRYNYF